MSENGSLESKCEESNEQNVQEAPDKPESPQMEVESSAVQPNLENSVNGKSECETSAETAVEEEKCVPSSISIKFHDDVISKAYKSKFLRFINSFAELKLLNVTDLTIDIHRDENFVGKSKEDADVEAVDATPTSAKKRKKHSKAKKELFVVDVTPSQDSSQSELRYTTKFTINTEKADDDPNQISKSCCFNCGEQHQLRDCPQPKDHAKINTARQKFKVQAKTSRYHADQEKYNHLQPGKISSELRKALGLHKNEAPHFVYLMRKFGYPPGWLEEAKFVHSHLDMFDIDGNHVKGTAAKKFNGLDESKIVEYPGFNVPFQKGIIDDYVMYRVPPYSETFSKKSMVSFFEKKFAQEEDDFEACDMEIDNDPDFSDLTKKELKLNLSMSRESRDSPSLGDLEMKKRQLLEALNDEQPKEEVKSLDDDPEKSLLAVKTTCFGTPLIKSNSPYSTLPNPDNFSKDVSPVINFENLPNSTGKYEQLSDVLQKVRDTLKKGTCNT